jgi:bifunctional polynucleotide phosphatase/kinase
MRCRYALQSKATFFALMISPDNTNRDKNTRADYVAIAKKLKARVRCVYFDVPPELAWHNNMYRAFHARVEGVSAGVVESVTETSAVVEERYESSEEEEKSKGKKPSKKTTTTTTKTTTTTTNTTASPRTLVPWIAYVTFRSKFQEPDETEGFDELVRVGFEFEGSEEERERWNTWMEL